MMSLLPIFAKPRSVCRAALLGVLAGLLVTNALGCSRQGDKQGLQMTLSGADVVVTTDPQVYSWWIRGQVRNPLPDPVVDVVVELAVEGMDLSFPVASINGKDSSYFEFTFYLPRTADPGYRLSVRGSTAKDGRPVEGGSIAGSASLPK